MCLTLDLYWLNFSYVSIIFYFAVTACSGDCAAVFTSLSILLSSEIPSVSDCE